MCFSRSALRLLTLAREKLLSQSMGEGRLERRSPVGDVKLFHAESSIVAGRAVPRQVFPRYDAHNLQDQTHSISHSFSYSYVYKLLKTVFRELQQS